jgi:DNA mismatch endonuclease (patch repair protein)
MKYGWGNSVRGVEGRIFVRILLFDLIFSANFVFMDVLTAEQRTKNMKAIKSTNTKMEVLFSKALWSKGIRYRKNDKSVFGKPDLTIKKYKIAVFIDSEYFHGKNWEIDRQRIKTNTEFWHKKIEGNIKRDELVNEALMKDGWKVFRFWSMDVKNKLDFCLDNVIGNIEIKRCEVFRDKA